MKYNMGNADRIIRTLAGVIAILLVIFLPIPGTMGWILITAGAVFILTSIAGVCPLYTLLGIKTCATRKKIS